ncbi:MAG: Uma2 family endonuclease, partial [Pseudanabaena sp.]
RSHAEAEHARYQAELERSYEQQARREAEAIATQATLAQQQAELKAQRLAEMLRSLGLNPDEM